MRQSSVKVDSRVKPSWRPKFFMELSQSKLFLISIACRIIAPPSASYDRMQATEILPPPTNDTIIMASAKVNPLAHCLIN